MSETPLTDAEVARILKAPMNHSSRFAAMVKFAERLERKIGRMQKIGDEMEQWVIRPHDAWAEEKKISHESQRPTQTPARQDPQPLVDKQPSEPGA